MYISAEAQSSSAVDEPRWASHTAHARSGSARHTSTNAVPRAEPCIAFGPNRSPGSRNVHAPPTRLSAPVAIASAVAVLDTDGVPLIPPRCLGLATAARVEGPVTASSRDQGIS